MLPGLLRPWTPVRHLGLACAVSEITARELWLAVPGRGERVYRLADLGLWRALEVDLRVNIARAIVARWLVDHPRHYMAQEDPEDVRIIQAALRLEEMVPRQISRLARLVYQLAGLPSDSNLADLDTRCDTSAALAAWLGLAMPRATVEAVEPDNLALVAVRAALSCGLVFELMRAGARWSCMVSLADGVITSASGATPSAALAAARANADAWFAEPGERTP